MRDFRFRGLNEETKEWHYGYFVKKLRLGGYGYYIIDDNGRSHSCIPSSIGLCTGLKDKYNEELYEGDVVNSNWYKDPHLTKILRLKVIREFERFLLSDSKGNKYSMRQLGELTKIGNIFENPELLEVK